MAMTARQGATNAVATMEEAVVGGVSEATEIGVETAKAAAAIHNTKTIQIPASAMAATEGTGGEGMTGMGEAEEAVDVHKQNASQRI